MTQSLRPAPLPERTPEWMPTLTMDRQIASARKRMGEARWAELNAEWDDPVGRDPQLIEQES